MFGTRNKAQPSVNGDAADAADVGSDLLQIKRDLHQQVISALDLSSIGSMPEKQLHEEVRRVTEQLCRQRKDLLNQHERDTLIAEVMDEVFGLGPLEPLFKDPEICDILVNGPHTVYIERRGRLELSRVKFIDEAHVLAIIHRVAGRVGRRVDETTPMVDARLPDGSRMNAIVAPLALGGPLVSIRRFGARPLMAADLLTNHSLTKDMYEFLAACVQARVNVLVSGGTGSGKTTLLNALSAAIPGDERVATIEDAAELQLQQPHVVRMETRPANIEGQGEITTRDLVRNALRMRPDRILVGECRGAEALDMLQAMNTGHEGSLTTVHANTPRDALGRLEIMVGMAGIDLPIWSIRRQIVSAIHVVVQTARLMGGARKVISVAEITGMEGDVISMHNIFEFRQTGLDKNRCAVGNFHANGIHPHCLARVRQSGITLREQMFTARVLDP
jgi:pilus assembly protein CpaF